MKLTFLDLGDGGDLLPGFLWDVVCFLAFQSIMSPTTQLPGAGSFRTEKGFLAESTFLVSCRLSLSISWAAEAGNPLKQMLGSKCSFLFFLFGASVLCWVVSFDQNRCLAANVVFSSVLFGNFVLLDCFVWSKHLLSWKVFLCLIPLSEIFSDLPRLICFECDPPKSLGTRTDRFIKRRWEDQNRYRPNRAAEEMRPKQGHFKDFAKNISCNFIRWRRWRSKQIGGRLRSKQQRNMSNRCDPTTTLCCGH